MIEIDTPAGGLAGLATESDGRGVHAFLGIPYATAARFAPPQVVTSWTGTRVATAFGPAAPQPVGGPLDGLVPGSFRGDMDEDACLTLNVWTPAASSTEPRPVLVWFPGGAFTVGASSQPAYDGARFSAEQDVVLVSCNYRLGALGFLDARDIDGVANCGLRDAIAALEWIRGNIAAFGGDPERVTVFGESAGGGIVLHLLASPSSRGLFGGAIVQSGATFNTLDDAGAATVRDTLLDALGTTDTKSLYEVSVDELLQAQSAAAMAVLATVGMMPFHPMVDGDVLPAAPAAALAGGSAAGVPLIIGTTTDEMRLFLDLSGPPAPREKLVKRVGRYVGVDANRAETIVTTYEADLGTTDANEIWAALFTDKEMAVPAAAMRDAQQAHASVFTYLFGRGAAVGGVGACHGIDIPFTFGNFGDGWADFVGLDADAERLGRTIRDAWAAFARTGDPGWPVTPKTMRLETATVVEDPLRARLASLG